MRVLMYVMVAMMTIFVVSVTSQKIPLPIDGCVPSSTQTCLTADQIPLYILTTTIYTANSSCATASLETTSVTTFINHKCSPDLFAFLPFTPPAKPSIPIPPATASPSDNTATLLNLIKIGRPSLANLDLVLVGYPADTGCFGPTSKSFPTFSNDTCVTVADIGKQVKMVWSIQGVASSVCLHKDSEINYQGKVYSFEEIEKHSDCSVPHTVVAQGVQIETSCKGKSLRLTGDHLLYSNKGLVAARTLRKGDVLYGDLKESKPCKITKIWNEDTTQIYKGLNCKESVVVANGIKASTFGKYHLIPSLWMKHASKVLGVERASRWGDHMVRILGKAGLV